MTRRLYRTQPMNRVKLTRIAYNKLRFMFDGQVGVIDFDKHDFEETGCTFGQADGLVNKALEVEGVRMAVLASERDDGIKMSLRAVEPDTVNDIAVLFRRAADMRRRRAARFMRRCTKRWIRCWPR